MVTLAAALFIGAKGELAVAIPLGIFGAGLLGWSPFGAQLGSAWGNYGPGAWKSQGQKSQVRSQFIEMTLDHDTGALQGLITAGPEAGRVLDEFTLDELIALARGFDAESWALLESYLDRRFPAWREHAQGAGAGGGWRRGTPCGVERKNDGGGGLSDPWPEAGRGARRDQPRSPRTHEETSSRPGGLDVPRCSGQRGQGHSSSQSSLTPARNITLQTASSFSVSVLNAPAGARRCPA